MFTSRPQTVAEHILEPMTTKDTMLVAAVGGMTASFFTYPAATGYAELILNLDIAELLGFALRLLGGALAGAMWAFLNCPEYEPRRAFQLGIVAPAAIAGLVYANAGGKIARADAPPPPAATQTGTVSSPSQFSIVGTAQAGEFSDLLTILTTKSRPGSFLDRVVKGLVGK